MDELLSKFTLKPKKENQCEFITDTAGIQTITQNGTVTQSSSIKPF